MLLFIYDRCILEIVFICLKSRYRLFSIITKLQNRSTLICNHKGLIYRQKKVTVLWRVTHFHKKTSIRGMISCCFSLCVQVVLLNMCHKVESNVRIKPVWNRVSVVYECRKLPLVLLLECFMMSLNGGGFICLIVEWYSD